MQRWLRRPLQSRLRAVLLETTGGESLAAQVYVIRPSREHLLDRRPWSLDTFLQGGTARFLRRERLA